MGNFANNAITDVGRMLLADVQAGAVFTPTRIVIGSGTMPSSATTQGMTDVITPVKSLQINKKKRTPDGKCIFGGVYTNEEVTVPFYFRELALYAKAVYLNEDGSVKSEGAEILYSYGNAGATADYMAAYSTSTVVEKQMDLVTWVGNNAQVDLTIESGVFVVQEDFASHATRHAADGEDPITPESIGAAPGGYGLGGTIGLNIPLNPDTGKRDFNLATNTGWYQIYAGDTYDNCYPYADAAYFGPGYSILRVEKNRYCVQTVEFTTPTEHYTLKRKSYFDDLSQWYPWEWVNPPMVPDKEYRTTERYKGNAVYKKTDENGNILWRAENETSWHLLSSASYVSPATVE